MATSSLFLHTLLTRRREINALPGSLKSLYFFMPATLALTTSLLILLYISSTSSLFFIHPLHRQFSASEDHGLRGRDEPAKMPALYSPESLGFRKSPLSAGRSDVPGELDGARNLESRSRMYSSDGRIFHDRDVFLKNYREMNGSLKIFVYQHTRDDPFANVLLPVDVEPAGNYASESYFKKVLVESHFITEDPSKADLFFLPFSIARLRHDPQVGIKGIQDFVKDYVTNVSREYPYWNRTGGADHFYVACHSIGRSAMEKAVEVKLNAIQLVCSSSYYLSSYVAHKDASLPQIWPRQDMPPNLPRERKKLAFFAGSINSPVRQKLLQEWGNDSERYPCTSGTLLRPTRRSF